jgi:8-oxo-dGTP diphosphatase
VAESAAPRLRVVAAVAWRDGLLLLTRRPPGSRFGLMWEFPGGKLEPGESPGQALARELREELGVGAVPGETLAVERHDYEAGPSVELHFVGCELESFDFTPSEAVHEVRWVRPAEVDPDEVLEADRRFLAALARPLDEGPDVG